MRLYQAQAILGATDIINATDDLDLEILPTPVEESLLDLADDFVSGTTEFGKAWRGRNYHVLLLPGPTNRTVTAHVSLGYNDTEAVLLNQTFDVTPVTWTGGFHPHIAQDIATHVDQTIRTHENNADEATRWLRE